MRINAEQISSKTEVRKWLVVTEDGRKLVEKATIDKIIDRYEKMGVAVRNYLPM